MLALMIRYRQRLAFDCPNDCANACLGAANTAAAFQTMRATRSRTSHSRAPCPRDRAHSAPALHRARRCHARTLLTRAPRAPLGRGPRRHSSLSGRRRPHGWATCCRSTLQSAAGCLGCPRGCRTRWAPRRKVEPCTRGGLYCGMRARRYREGVSRRRLAARRTGVGCELRVPSGTRADCAMG